MQHTAQPSGQAAAAPRQSSGPGPIRLMPATVPVAFHAMLPQGQCPPPPASQQLPQQLLLQQPGPSGTGTTTQLPFPQPRRPGRPLDADGTSTHSGMLASVLSAPLPSSTSAALPHLPPPGPGSAAVAAHLVRSMQSGPSPLGPGHGGLIGEGGGADASAGDSHSHHLHQQQQQQQAQQQGQQASHGPPQAAGQERRPRSAPALSEPRKSKYRGVQWERGCSKWRARIHTDKTRHIGYFDDEDSAAQAWDQAALKHFGESWQSKLNFPEISMRRFKAELEAAGGAGTGAATAGGGSGAGGGAGAHEAAGAARPSVQKQYRGVQQEGSKFKALLQQKRSHTVIGTYDTAEEAARAYDLETLRVNGSGAITNFPLADYAAELERWQEAYNMVISSHLSGGPHSAAPSAIPRNRSLTHFGGGGAASRDGGAATTHTAAGGSAGAGVAAGGGSGELPAVTSGGPSPARAAAGSPTLAGQKRKLEEGGVVRVGDRWQASISLDLGSFSFKEEACRAHDRLSVLVHGFTSHGLHAPLQEALQEARSACLAARGRSGSGGSSGDGCGGESGGGLLEPPVHAGYRGVAPRNGAYLALLDIGASEYELGPFPTPMEAAQAYDRYSLLLHGLAAKTNFPLWSYLAPEPEVASLVTAVQTVQAQQAQRKRQRDESGSPTSPPLMQQRRGSPPQAGAAGAEALQQQRQAGAAWEGGRNGALPLPPHALHGRLTGEAGIWSNHPFRTWSGGGSKGSQARSSQPQAPKQQQQQQQAWGEGEQPPKRPGSAPQAQAGQQAAQQVAREGLEVPASGAPPLPSLSLLQGWGFHTAAASLESLTALQPPPHSAGPRWVPMGGEPPLNLFPPGS